MVYSNDLRWRIVDLCIGRRMRKTYVALNLRISVATVVRVVKRFKRNGNVKPSKLGRPDISKLLNRPQLLILMEYVLRNPSAYLKEMAQHLLQTTGSAYEAESIRSVLRRNGYSRKRVSKIGIHILSC